jgi:hypothetical protein
MVSRIGDIKITGKRINGHPARAVESGSPNPQRLGPQQRGLTEHEGRRVSRLIRSRIAPAEDAVILRIGNI